MSINVSVCHYTIDDDDDDIELQLREPIHIYHIRI